MIVEADSPAFDDREEQSSRGRQSMTLPRNLHQHQQQYRPPQPPQQDQLDSMKRSSFNHSVPPVSLQTMVSPPPPPLPSQTSAGPIPQKTGILSRNSSLGIDSLTSPPPPPLLNGGSCVDSGLGGSDSSSLTFAEMHHVSAEVGPLQHLMPNGVKGWVH